MADFKQLKAGLRQASTNQQAATTFLKDPATAWQKMGGALPPGVTSAQFSQRLAQNHGNVHSNIVAASKGQMSAQDWSSCGECMVFVWLVLSVGGLLGTAVLPEATLEWAAGYLDMTATVLKVLLTSGSALTPSGPAFGICVYLGQCTA